MTFTASRVKQEIAKEGILPYSLIFATGQTTPAAWLKNQFFKSQSVNTSFSEKGDSRTQDPLEQSPIAALGLHWLSSIFLIAVTSRYDSATAYSFLITLYSYVIAMLIGVLTSVALLYCKFFKNDWTSGKNIWVDLPLQLYFGMTEPTFMFVQRRG
jgi:hypothetical protein